MSVETKAVLGCGDEGCHRAVYMNLLGVYRPAACTCQHGVRYQLGYPPDAPLIVAAES